MELPLGLGGTNGLIEVTVIDEGVPFLLPIGLLRSLRAAVDLDEVNLRLKTLNAQTQLREVKSGHVACRLTDFASRSWFMPDEAHSHAHTSGHGDFSAVATRCNESFPSSEGVRISDFGLDQPPGASCCGDESAP